MADYDLDFGKAGRGKLRIETKNGQIVWDIRSPVRGESLFSGTAAIPPTSLEPYSEGGELKAFERELLQAAQSWVLDFQNEKRINGKVLRIGDRVHIAPALGVMKKLTGNFVVAGLTGTLMGQWFTYAGWPGSGTAPAAVARKWQDSKARTRTRLGARNKTVARRNAEVLLIPLTKTGRMKKGYALEVNDTLIREHGTVLSKGAPLAKTTRSKKTTVPDCPPSESSGWITDIAKQNAFIASLKPGDVVCMRTTGRAGGNYNVDEGHWDAQIYVRAPSPTELQAILDGKKKRPRSLSKAQQREDVKRGNRGAKAAEKAYAKMDPARARAGLQTSQFSGTPKSTPKRWHAENVWHNLPKKRFEVQLYEGRKGSYTGTGPYMIDFSEDLKKVVGSTWGLEKIPPAALKAARAGVEASQTYRLNRQVDDYEARPPIGSRVRGTFGLGTVTGHHEAWNEPGVWVEFDDLPGDAKMARDVELVDRVRGVKAKDVKTAKATAPRGTQTFKIEGYTKASDWSPKRATGTYKTLEGAQKRVERFKSHWRIVRYINGKRERVVDRSSGAPANGGQAKLEELLEIETKAKARGTVQPFFLRILERQRAEITESLESGKRRRKAAKKARKPAKKRTSSKRKSSSKKKTAKKKPTLSMEEQLAIARRNLT